MMTFAMYRALLAEQWKHQRVEITALSIAAAVACPACVWMVTGGEYQPWQLVETGGKIGFAGAWIALITGVACSIRPYVLDARAKHTYALSLPVPRSDYSLLRVGSGLSLTLVPGVAFLIGASIAAQAAPPGTLLQTFPLQLTLRFALAAAFAFSFVFGVQYGLGRQAVRWLMIAGLTVIGVEVVGQLALHVSMTAPFFDLIVTRGSPLRVFMTRWTLFNV